MENLNTVPSTGTFGNSVQKINSNFDLIVNAINSLEYKTTRSKGILNYGQNPATVFPNAVAGDWCMILSEGNVFPATIKTYNGSTWSGSGTWNPDGVDLTGYAKTTDMTTAITNSLAQATARMGYGECTVNGTSLEVSIPNFILPTSGGTIHIKMSAAGTGASTLNINNTGEKTLWYNGKAVSAQNTWEAGEIISVFYDGTRFMASNSQGGGGDAEKINYDNSQSGLNATDVQGALDELSNSVVNTDDAQASLDISDQEGYVIARLKGGNIQTLNFDSGKATVLGGANEEDSNLDVADEYGNVIARFENGHIRTKNFDSSINGSAVPEYWKTYLDNKKSELIAAELSIGLAGASFIFITDVHWKDNYKKSPAIISYIRQITQVKDVICGGDILEAHGARAAKIAEMLDWNECVKPVGCINLVGNHDYNTSDQPKSTWDVNRIKPEEFYRMCNSETEKVVSYDYTNNVSVSEAGYRFNAGRYTEYFGFCDNNTQKIRYIFLDSTCCHKSVSDGMTSSDLRISDAQLRWMQDRITELEEGWTILVFTHIALGADGLFEIGQQIENALDGIYDSVAATIAGVICGHCHKTLSYISTKGYPFISTTCDARKQSQAANDPTGYSNGGDVDEQAFDVYYVNTKNRTIDVIRIGAGDTDSNRNFTY